MTASLKSKLQVPSTTYPIDIFHYEQAYKQLNITPLETTELVNIVSAVLREMFKKTDKLYSPSQSVFQAKEPARMSIASYLMMVAEGFKCSQECIILAMIYIDRLTRSNTKLVIKSTNIHRLMITAIMLATKFIDDKSYKNEFYARVGGVSPKEINLMESEFLQAIGFDLYVNPVLFFKYREQLIALGRPLLRS